MGFHGVTLLLNTKDSLCQGSKVRIYVIGADSTWMVCGHVSVVAMCHFLLCLCAASTWLCHMANSPFAQVWGRIITNVSAL